MTPTEIAEERLALILARALTDPRHEFMKLVVDNNGDCPIFYLDIDQIGSAGPVTNRYRLALIPTLEDDTQDRCDECTGGRHLFCTDIEDDSCCCPPNAARHYFEVP